MKILYIGNNLTSKSKYNSTMSTLCFLFKNEGIDVIQTSSKINKFTRFVDMFYTLITNFKSVNFVLIDTYSTQNFYYALLLSQMSRVLKKKYIPILHGGNLPLRLDQNPIWSRMIFKNSFQNIAPSGYLKYEFEQRGYKSVFIPNVLNIEEYQFTQRFKIQPKLLWVRAFANLYNPKMAILVLNELKKTHPQAKLGMVGPDKGDGSFQATQMLVKELQLEDSVIFTGVLPKEQWHKLSEKYDVFINTTTIDNTPVSVMEAMALGLPIVSTNVGGIPYLLDENKDGLLVESNDVMSMYQKVVQLISNHTIVNDLTNNARKKAESFAWEHVKHMWLKLLN